MDWTNKRVLLTGAAGFIGSHVLRRLVNLGANVVAVDNFSLGRKQNISFFDGELLTLDVSDPNFVKHKWKDFDFIFHFASPCSVILFNRAPERAFRKTISGFMNIMELAIRVGAKKVVYPSSGSVYGRCPPPQSENMVPEPVNLYGIAKLTTEKIAEYYSDKVKSVGLRIFAGYGPGEDHKGEIASPITIFLKCIMKGESPIVFGNGTQSRDFIYIEDIVETIIRSAEKETPPILNVGSGNSYSFNDAIKLICSLLGKKIEPKYVPKPMKYLEKTKADITLMKSFLGITPLSLREGLEKYIELISE